MSKNYKSKSGRLWTWCNLRKCWQFEDYKYKIYFNDGAYLCSIHGSWVSGEYESFEDAEQAVMDESPMPVAIDNQYTNDIPFSGQRTDPGDDVYAQQDPPNDSGWVASAITAAPVMMASGTQATGKWKFTSSEMDIAEEYTFYRNRHLATVEAYDGSTLLTITGHGITADSLVYARGGNMPGNVVAGKQYYLRAGDADTFELSATAGGAALSLGAVTGTLVMFITAASKRSVSDEVIAYLAADNTQSQLALILADTNELQTDITDGGRTDELIDAIIAKTALINSGKVNTVDRDRTTISITRNDSYDGTANPKITFTTASDFTGWTGLLTVRHRTTDEIIIQKASDSIVSATQILVTLDVADTACTAITSDQDYGPHPYDLQVTSGSSVQTPIEGACVISRDETR